MCEVVCCTWSIRKENEVELQRAEMTMVRWMCDMKLLDRIPSKGLRERLGLDDIILVLQQNRLRGYGHVLRKEDNDWMKKCTKHEVQGTTWPSYSFQRYVLSFFTNHNLGFIHIYSHTSILQSLCYASTD